MLLLLLASLNLDIFVNLGRKPPVWIVVVVLPRLSLVAAVSLQEEYH